jgi:hypothetical protein
MKALADFIVSGRFQAMLVAAASGILAFLAPPWSTLLVYLGAASIALVTLRVSPTKGLQVLVIATLLTGLFYQVAGVSAAAIAVILLMMWLPCWIASGVLWQTTRMSLAMLSGAGVGLVVLVLVYAVHGDPAPWWFERLQPLEAALEQSGLFKQDISAEQLMQDMSRLMTGVVLASLVLSALSSTLLGRWWQALQVNPGGLRTEFNSLRFGQTTGLLTLGAMIFAQLAGGSVRDMMAQAVMIMLVPYLFAGLAVIHGLVAGKGRGRGWLIAVYVLLAILPQSTLLLAGGGLLDTWIDFRRRFGGGGTKPAE